MTRNRKNSLARLLIIILLELINVILAFIYRSTPFVEKLLVYQTILAVIFALYLGDRFRTPVESDEGSTNA